MPGASFILASGSPRRAEILRQCGVTDFGILPADIDETPRKKEHPFAYARRLAVEKARAAAQARPGEFVLAADTAVCKNGALLDKAGNDDDVARYLRLLSGGSHQVITAMCLYRPRDGRYIPAEARARIRFKRLSEGDIRLYLRTGEGIGKAGGYAIQGAAARFVIRVTGSYGAVVGLPAYEALCLLEGNGVFSAR